MNETLYSSGMLNSTAGLVLAGLIGFFFGTFLQLFRPFVEPSIGEPWQARRRSRDETPLATATTCWKGIGR